jgi:Domain of unknown function (DUF4271)
MIQTDSIQVLRDSVTPLPNETLAKIDTAKSLHPQLIADTLKTIIPPRGFKGIPRPSLPYTENWVFITLLSVFIVLVISRSVNVVYEAAKTFFQVKERISIFNKTTISDMRTKLLMVVYPILVFSLYAYFIFHKQDTEFELLQFGVFTIAFSVFFFLKYVLMKMVGFVFVEGKTLKMFMDNYFNVVVFTTIVLFPFLVVRIYAPSYLIPATEMISILICIFSSLLIIIKLFQIFSQKTVVTFYILLYLCTLEILPLLGLIKLIEFII